jgi:hypothetical protein
VDRDYDFRSRDEVRELFTKAIGLFKSSTFEIPARLVQFRKQNARMRARFGSELFD